MENFITPVDALSEDEGTPLWSESYRGIPNAFVRSGLINISLPEKCGFIRPIIRIGPPSTYEFKIRYKGEPLEHSDIDVLMEIIHLVRDQLRSTTGNLIVETSKRELLRRLGKCVSSGKNGLQLWHSIRRLSECMIMIGTTEYTFQGHLLDGCYMDLKSRKIGIIINPDVKILFEDGRWTKLNISQRKALRRKPLALWLHGFYSSFADNHNHQYDLKTIRLFCMSVDRDLFGFRRNVKNALGRLKSAACWIGDIDQNDRIVVTR